MTSSEGISGAYERRREIEEQAERVRAEEREIARYREESDAARERRVREDEEARLLDEDV